MKKKEQKPQTNLGNQKSISEALQLSSVPIILPQKYNETEEMSGLQCSAILQSKDLDYTPKKLASVCSTGHSEHFQTEWECTLPEALHIPNFRRSFIFSQTALVGVGQSRSWRILAEHLAVTSFWTLLKERCSTSTGKLKRVCTSGERSYCSV